VKSSKEEPGLFIKSSVALDKFAYFLRRFGYLDVKSESPQVKQMLAYVQGLEEMSESLKKWDEAFKSFR